MADNKKRRNHVISERDDEWLQEQKEEYGIDKSWLVRRALLFYRNEGRKRDKMYKKKIKGEI